MSWILVIHEVAQIGVVIKSCMEAASSAAIVCVSNLKEARQVLRRRVVDECQLIVSSLSPPVDAEQPMPVDRGIATAIEFLRDIRQGEDGPPCILIDPAPTFAQNAELAGMKNVLIMAVPDIVGYLTGNARSMIANEPLPASEENHLLDVEISITGNICNWHLMGKKGVGIDETGSINLNKDSLERLLLDSETVGRISPTSDGLEAKRKLVRRLGRDLYRCINEPGESRGLWEAVSLYTNRMRLLEKTRFRFQVDSVTSQLLVEALTREDKEQPDADDYWMLRTPMVRRFGPRADRSPLFTDSSSREKPVECLIILGNPNKFQAGGAIGKGYATIRNASEEIKWLSDYLTNDSDLFGLAKPKVMRYDEHAAGTFGHAVRETLQQGQWQLIHYSGHSDIGTNGAGYLVLGDHDDDHIDIEEFARSASHAQFIFLNSCCSANVRFVQRSVERSVPAVAGYAWPIRDDIAAAFSREFYSNLFGRKEKPSDRLLEYAFLRARRYLHKEYEREAVWSAPLLFMQSMASEPDRLTTQRRPS